MREDEIFTGQKVYARDLYGNVFSGLVEKVSWEHGRKIMTIGCSCYVARDGKEYAPKRGTIYKIAKELFSDYKSIYDIIDAEIEAEKNSYKKDIHTVEDLLAFPLRHKFGPEDDEESQNELAMQAYLELCRELAGVDLDEYGNAVKGTGQEEDIER